MQEAAGSKFELVGRTLTHKPSGMFVITKNNGPEGLRDAMIQLRQKVGGWHDQAHRISQP